MRDALRSPPEMWMDSQAFLALCSPNNWNVNISDKHCCSAREPEVFLSACLLLLRENMQDAEDQTPSVVSGLQIETVAALVLDE